MSKAVVYGDDGKDIPAAAGVMFDVVRKSSLRLELERVARRALRFAAEVVRGRWAAGALLEEEVGFASVGLVVGVAAAAAAAAGFVVDRRW